MRLLIAFVVLVVASVAAFFMWPTIDHLLPKPATNAVPQVQPIATALYQCNGGKSIQAAFYEGTTTPASGPDQPPIPGGSAKVMLSDGRTMTLAQTISADGVRYSNGDPMVQGSETFVFWTKGNGALVLENDQEKNYTGCTATSSPQ